MRLSRVSNLPLNWLAISCESPNALTYFAPQALANCIPAMRASYSASLLEAVKSSLNGYSMTLLCGDIM